MQTMRELSAYIAEFLFLQDKESTIDRDAECAYRGDNGLMCAVGCIIKDEYYDAAFEGQKLVTEDDNDALQLAVARSLGLEKLPCEVMAMLNLWQNYHDSSRLDGVTQSYNSWITLRKPECNPRVFHEWLMAQFNDDYFNADKLLSDFPM